MKNALSFEIAACSDYEDLLEQCQSAFVRFHEKREEVRHHHLTGVEVGRELLTLQARYAKCYNALLKHSKTCNRCRFGSTVGRRPSPQKL